MRLHITSPALAQTYALEMLREEMQNRPVRPSRADRRAEKQAARAARSAERQPVPTPTFSHRLARSFRLAH